MALQGVEGKKKQAAILHASFSVYFLFPLSVFAHSFLLLLSLHLHLCCAHTSTAVKNRHMLIYHNLIVNFHFFFPPEVCSCFPLLARSYHDCECHKGTIRLPLHSQPPDVRNLFFEDTVGARLQCNPPHLQTEHGQQFYT